MSRKRRRIVLAYVVSGLEDPPHRWRVFTDLHFAVEYVFQNLDDQGRVKYDLSIRVYQANSQKGQYILHVTNGALVQYSGAFLEPDLDLTVKTIGEKISAILENEI